MYMAVNSSWVRIVLLVLAGCVVLPVVLYRMLVFTISAPQEAHIDSSVPTSRHGTMPPVLKVNLLDLLEGEEIPQEATPKRPPVLSKHEDVQVNNQVKMLLFSILLIY